MKQAMLLLLLALGAAAAAQDYQPAEWMTVQPDGGLTVHLGGATYRIGPFDCADVPPTANESMHTSWQRLEEGQWVHLRGTRRNPNRFCGLGGLAQTTGAYRAPFGGEYRAVVEVQGDTLERYVSHNTVVIVVTSIPRRSWGAVKGGR